MRSRASVCYIKWESLSSCLMSSEEAPPPTQQLLLCQGYNTLIFSLESRVSLASLHSSLGTHTHKHSSPSQGCHMKTILTRTLPFLHRMKQRWHNASPV